MQVYSRSVAFGLHAIQGKGRAERLFGHVVRGHRQKLAFLFSAELIVVFQ